MRAPWSDLNHLQIGRYAEYLVKMEFTRYGFEVYSSEVDDRGIDFVVRTGSGAFFEVQVKSVRGLNYIFVPKSHGSLSPSRLLAIVMFPKTAAAPKILLIPMARWHQPDSVFVDRDYVGRKSSPEWGVNLSTKNLPRLADFVFAKTASRLKSTGSAT